MSRQRTAHIHILLYANAPSRVLKVVYIYIYIYQSTYSRSYMYLSSCLYATPRMERRRPV